MSRFSADSLASLAVETTTRKQWTRFFSSLEYFIKSMDNYSGLLDVGLWMITLLRWDLQVQRLFIIRA